MVSPVEKSHYDPVTHFHWLLNRNGTECVTTSTDGRVMWWDTRRFEEPVDVLNIVENPKAENPQTLGGTVLEYNVEAGPTKFLVGTEQGTIVTANKRLNRGPELTTAYGVDTGRHLGPVYSIHRN